MNNVSSTPDFQTIKTAMRSSWMAGDFGVIARMVTADAESFVARLVLPAGTRVLDVATGTGNLALPLADAGCIVTGVDIAPNLLEQARERAFAEGLTVQFDEGDAEALPYPDASFDAVVTMFGAMFAPRPERVAAELARVLRPGGMLAMANWTPQGFAGKMFATGAKHVTPPAGVPPPVKWGDEATVRERLQESFSDIQAEVIPLQFKLDTNAAGAVDLFRRYFGPTKTAFSRLDEAGRQAFAADLEALWAGANVADDTEKKMLVPNEYLRVAAVRKG